MRHMFPHQVYSQVANLDILAINDVTVTAVWWCMGGIVVEFNLFLGKHLSTHSKPISRCPQITSPQLHRFRARARDTLMSLPASQPARHPLIFGSGAKSLVTGHWPIYHQNQHTSTHNSIVTCYWKAITSPPALPPYIGIQGRCVRRNVYYTHRHAAQSSHLRAVEVGKRIGR